MTSQLWSHLKLKEYYFGGTSDPDEYFEWEQKMNEFFISCGRPEFEKVFLAADQLINQAQDWWRQYTSGHLRQPSCDEMKNLLKKQYIPRDHYHEVRRQFRTLFQDDKTVMEYQSQFKYLRIRLNPGVSNEAVMDQFVYGLRDEIRVHIRRYTCSDLEELLQRAVQIELNTKEPDPPDPPNESPLPTFSTEEEEPSDEVQLHSCDTTMSHEQVLRTKLFEERGNNAILISTDDIIISTVKNGDVVIKTVAEPEANQMHSSTNQQTGQDLCSLKMVFLSN